MERFSRKLVTDNQDEDMLALALMVLSVLRDTDEYGAITHLAYALNRKDFFNLIDMYGGTTLRIPTHDEVDLALRSLMFYYWYYIKHMSLNVARIRSGFGYRYGLEDEVAIKRIEKYLEKIDYVVKHFKGKKPSED